MGPKFRICFLVAVSLDICLFVVFVPFLVASRGSAWPGSRDYCWDYTAAIHPLPSKLGFMNSVPP